MCGGAGTRLWPASRPSRPKQFIPLATYRVGAYASSGVQVWRGACPMLPDGPPAIGATAVPGLWLNLGHGASGWSLSNGSARLLADLLGGRTPSVDPEGLGVERLAA